MQSTIASNSDGRTSTPPINNGADADTQSRATPSTGLTQPKALQLGGSKTNASTVAAQLAEQVAADESGIDTWGINDLMDVNADEGDWSKPSYISALFVFTRLFFSGAFESAPAIAVSTFSTADLGFGAPRPSSPRGTLIHNHLV